MNRVAFLNKNVQLDALKYVQKRGLHNVYSFQKNLVKHRKNQLKSTDFDGKFVRKFSQKNSLLGGKNKKLTAQMYPNLKRDDRYSVLNDKDIEYFKSILPEKFIVQDSTDLEHYNEDFTHKYIGQSRLVLKPQSTEQVSKILKHCYERSLAVVPQGGDTGLVGGSVPVFDEIVLSLSGLNKIHSLDELSGILIADAGCILEVVDNYLAEKNFIFPLDLGAKGSCFIGGNVATNAGGIRLLRYGSLHGSVLGVEAVKADGTIINALSTMRKDNTGYDLKQLFIGSEGTLGVVTKVSILCPPRPKAVNAAFFALDSYEKVLETFKHARSDLGEILSAYEFMDSKSYNLVSKYIDSRKPLESDNHPFYVLLETSGSNKEHDDAKLEKFLEDVMEKEIISDGVVSQDETQLKNLWSWRESISEMVSYQGGVYKYDLSIPLGQLYDIVNDVQAHLESLGLVSATDKNFPVIEALGYGHVGDGNIHLNIPVRFYDKKVENALEPFVFEWIQKHNGSVSAEHGVGFAKKPFIGYSKDETSIHLMKQLKDLLDPKHILNPYKVL